MDTLEQIRNDHVSGATEIAIQCAQFLQEQAEHISTDEPDEFVSKFVHVGDQLKEAQPAMAPVYNAVHSILTQVKKSCDEGATITQLRNAAAKAAQNFTNRLIYAMKSIATYGDSLITNQCSILTYSSSRAVAAILKHAKAEGKSFNVFVPESRPMYEGRLLAQDLSTVGIPCTIIVDGAISAFIDQADIVLVGADRVSETSAVNKIGTRGIALMAKDAHVPIYCACETSKFLSSKLLSFDQNEMPTEEIWMNSPEHVLVRNIYFEEISLELITGIITERGILKEEEVVHIVTTHSPYI